jgi:hypothetical protein
VPLVQSDDPEAMQYGSWSTRGRYFYLQEGQPGRAANTYVVDTADETPTARDTTRALGESWPSSSPDDRFYAFTRPELWIMKPNDEDFALRIDQAIAGGGGTVTNSAFSSDGYHVWFVLNDGRCFVDDTLMSTPPHPIEVTPNDLPEGWKIDHAYQVPNAAFLLAASTDDEPTRQAHQDQTLYYLPRAANGQYAAAQRVDVAGIRYLLAVE